MSSFAAASTIPVTNKVAHANSRKSLRIRVITSPMRTAPYTADVPGPAADVMGIPPTLRTTPDGSIGSPPGELFLDEQIPFMFRAHQPPRVKCMWLARPKFRSPAQVRTSSAPSMWWQRARRSAERIIPLPNPGRVTNPVLSAAHCMSASLRNRLNCCVAAT
jgi:hypothetical protein